VQLPDERDEPWTTIRGVVVIVAIVAGTRVGRANK
jgi:hypothetical protein